MPRSKPTAMCWPTSGAIAAERLLVALNLGREPRTVATPEVGNGQILLSTHLDREEAGTGANIELRPDEGVIVSLRGIG